MLHFRAIFLLAVVLSSAFLSAADTKTTPTIHDFTANMKVTDGLFPMFWDAKSGRLYLEVNQFDQAFLFLTSLPYGLGQNDVGLDRGKLGQGVVVHFTRVGPKVLLVQPNLEYRSSSPDPAERLAVTQSFAESVPAGFKVEAEENGAALIDVTDFLMSDQFGVIKQLTESKQGAYKVDKDRSAIALDSTKNFPLNTEIEVMLTFTIDKPAERSLVQSHSESSPFASRPRRSRPTSHRAARSCSSSGSSWSSPYSSRSRKRPVAVYSRCGRNMI